MICNIQMHRGKILYIKDVQDFDVKIKVFAVVAKS